MADGARARLRAQWRELFRTFDAVICPIMPTPAYPHDHSPTRKRAASGSTARITSIRISWRGPASPPCPACRRPRSRLGFSPDGLPVGVQIVGPWLEDRTPLKLAELIEREFGGFKPPPMFDD